MGLQGLGTVEFSALIASRILLRLVQSSSPSYPFRTDRQIVSALLSLSICQEAAFGKVYDSSFNV